MPRTHVDDEYASASSRDPKIMITTSRDPSSRLTQFAKELKLVFPGAQRLNRGGQVPASSASLSYWDRAVDLHLLLSSGDVNKQILFTPFLMSCWISPFVRFYCCR